MSATVEQRAEDSRARMQTEKPLRNLVQLGFWAPGLAFTRRCTQAGVRVHLMDLLPDHAHSEHHSGSVASTGGAITWGEVGTEAGLNRILDYVRAVHADAISTVDELSLHWLAKNRTRFEPECRVMASPAASIARLLDKTEQTRLAQASGFRILDTWLLDPGSAGETVPQSAYPICIRPTAVNSIEPRFKARRIQSDAELSGILKELSAWHAPLIAQRFCTGANIALHAVRSTSGEIIAMQAFRAYRRYHGFALSIERCDLPAEVAAAAKRFAIAADLDGPFHFDLLEDDDSGHVYFLEVNFRMGGTTAKAVKLGYDEPMLALAAYGLQPPHTPPPLRVSRRTTSKATLLAQVLSAVKGTPDEFAYPPASRVRVVGSALWELLTVPDALLSMRDLRGNLSYLQRGRRRSF